MTQPLFGGGPADVIVKKVADADAVGGFVLVPDSTTVWEVMTTRTGSTLLSPLTDLSGATITTVVGDPTDGSYAFFGPDGYTGEAWLRNQASPSSKRWRASSNVSGGGVGTVLSVNSVSPDGSGNVVLAKADVGLGNVTNTSDANKPVSTAQATALALKADDTDLANYAPVGHTHTGADITDANIAGLVPAVNGFYWMEWNGTAYVGPAGTGRAGSGTSDPALIVHYYGGPGPTKSGTGSTGAVTGDVWIA